MTWSGQFEVSDVVPTKRGLRSVIEVTAVATVADGTLQQNTEHAVRLELRAEIEADETTIKKGDVWRASGHFAVNGA